MISVMLKRKILILGLVGVFVIVIPWHCTTFFATNGTMVVSMMDACDF